MVVRMRGKYVNRIKATGKGVAELWKNTYQHRDGSWAKIFFNMNPGETYKQLVALGEDPDIVDVARAIGNKNWSYITCCCCGEYVTEAVELGEYHPKSPYCETCLSEAQEVLRNDPY